MEPLSKKIISLYLVLFLLVAIPLTIIAVGISQERRGKAATVYPKNMTLRLVSIPSVVTVGEIFTLQIMLHPQSQPVASLQMALNYSGNLEFQGQAVTGLLSEFSYQPNVVDPTLRLTQLASYLKNPAAPFSSATETTYASMQFKALAAGPASVQFQPNITAVFTLGDAENKLASISDWSLVIATPTPPPIPTPSPSPTPAKSNLSFKVRFQGISQEKFGLTVRVILRQQGVEKYRIDPLPVSFNPDGSYRGTISSLDAGIYDVYIKGWAHLQKFFGPVSLVPGVTTNKDWSGFELLAGDITGPNNTPPDNRVDGADFAILTGDFDPFNPARPGVLSDLDLSGRVDGADFALLSSNYNPFQKGDE